jgi:hypothetical protein
MSATATNATLRTGLKIGVGLRFPAAAPNLDER